MTIVCITVRLIKVEDDPQAHVWFCSSKQLNQETEEKWEWEPTLKARRIGERVTKEKVKIEDATDPGKQIFSKKILN